MYTLFIKDNGTDVDIVITRSMLALAAIAAMAYRTDQNYYLSMVLSAALLLTAVFIKFLLATFRIKKIVLLIGAAVVLFIATRSIAFALILLVYGYLVKFLHRKPVIAITEKKVVIRKLLGDVTYRWDEFTNIILKDGLLTLDFVNNKLIQVQLDDDKEIDERDFNYFCSRLLKNAG